MSPRTTTKKSALVVGVMVLSTVVTGCVLPEDEHARGLEDVPPALLTTTIPSSIISEPVEPEKSTFELHLYWHDSDNILVKITRLLDAEPQIDAVLVHLLGGPSEQESLMDGGLVTPRATEALAPTTRRSDNGVLVITVADEFQLRDLGDDKNLIAEELVCTLTGISGVAAVTIEDSLGEIDLSGFEARPITGAARRADFNECAVQEPEPTEDPDSEETG